eukprot:CAMPEP_0175044244 /NCGR_PEP_ID=MMETSP0052_2-20121109/3686_1 /TAXON_ID=51329 ORGANISM="Polytomella parva, Strain SAG 63-3" /NCGR_SAMPLE_ID=MMETSP0052_2 /ASSEMBLY_ACC=CAM_ASM_000194 /LENGTH=315 /DNA_ID=CAMNT_0016307495 /DNA_START=17 /DNA_END=960 /DNA_ORIENTATION=-
MGACVSVTNGRALSSGSIRVAPEDIKSAWSKKELGSFQDLSRENDGTNEYKSMPGSGADDDDDEEDETIALANRRPKSMSECCISLKEVIYFYQTFIDPIPDGISLSTSEVAQYVILPILEATGASRWVEISEDTVSKIPIVPPAHLRTPEHGGGVGASAGTENDEYSKLRGTNASPKNALPHVAIINPSTFHPPTAEANDEPHLFVRYLAVEYGNPDYFISHAWSSPFSQTVSSLVMHLRSRFDAPDSTRLWIDLFAINHRRTFPHSSREGGMGSTSMLLSSSLPFGFGKGVQSGGIADSNNNNNVPLFANHSG